MYWDDSNENKQKFIVPDDVVDVSFKVQCKQLPLDHAYALSQCIQQQLPWIKGEKYAGIHLIHGAESGNGWMRPEEPDALLNLSRRTKFMLRVPKERVKDTYEMVDTPLDVLGNKIVFSNPQIKLFSPLKTIFCRHLISEYHDEAEFLSHAAEQLFNEGIKVSKMLCGRGHVLRMPDKEIKTRSLMIDGLEFEQSIQLQQNGLGKGRMMGCGLFIPHKGIDAVGQAQESLAQN